MTTLQTIRTEQRARWMDVLSRSFKYDFYHLPEYHALAEEQGEGTARLFVYREGEHFIAIPLLLRPIGALPCHARWGEELWDATSVYGYAGPIASHPEIPASVVRSFQTALRDGLLERNIVTAFSRLHPLLPQREFLTNLGEYAPLGPTVSIDLDLDTEVQRSQYRKNHKRDINKLRRLGARCFHDQDRRYFDEFVSIYYENMRRVDASEDYYFDNGYFDTLALMDSRVHLFICMLESTVICGGLFFSCDGIVQYHLGGTRDAFLELSPLKLVLDTARLWANEHQARVYHLGGGVNSREDALFHFKAGFSNRTHEFAVWRSVLLPEVYDQLCVEKAQGCERYAPDRDDLSFFPAYRCSDCPRVWCDSAVDYKKD
jgi:hypothetical protein